MSDSEGTDAPASSVSAKGKDPRKWKRGAHANARSRACQFPGIMEVRGDAMWCGICNVPVNFKEKCSAANHIKSAKHVQNAAKKPTLVDKPGPSAPLKEEAKQDTHAENSALPPPKKQKLGNVKTIFTGLNTKEHITDDFVAAFLQAGLPLNKLDHPSICGLVQKYTQVCPQIASFDSFSRHFV